MQRPAKHTKSLAQPSSFVQTLSVPLTICSRPSRIDTALLFLSARAGNAVYSCSLPNCFARTVFQLRLPGTLNQLDDRRRNSDIIQIGSHRRALGIGPVEELQHFLALGGIGLGLVHQDESCAGDRPAVLARLIGDDHAK